MRTLVLASQSPRRKELLERAGYEFQVISPQISEIPNENLNLEGQIRDLAEQKTQALLLSGKLLDPKDILILAADTVVVFDGQIIGKPKDSLDAMKILRLLSGQTHGVITAVCFHDTVSGRRVIAHEWAHVTFRTLSDAEIQSYVASGDPLDKAGAYGIQGVGGTFVAHLNGALDNVMGLPVRLVTQIFEENGWNISTRKS